MELEEEVRHLKQRIAAIPFIDTFDLRYNNRIKQPKPTTQAVMFCVMDVSGSMDPGHKDIAKRFFILLYLFLKRNYEHIEVVFIRHHTTAKEVDEEEFFLLPRDRRHDGVQRAETDARDHRRALSGQSNGTSMRPGLGRRQLERRFSSSAATADRKLLLTCSISPMSRSRRQASEPVEGVRKGIGRLPGHFAMQQIDESGRIFIRCSANYSGSAAA